MAKNSPSKFRHDGTSPLPLGMDWSPPPKNWDGEKTIWPHDPCTGWSYCVTIPSWTINPESRTPRDSRSSPIVFFRVLVGVQSPQGISAGRVILRRFSNFLNLFSAIKRAFPKKNIPPAPAKYSLIRSNSSPLFWEERRYALEVWMGNILSDINVSRSIPVAAFLELEAAVRSSFQDVSQRALETSLLGGAIVKTTSVQSRLTSVASAADLYVASVSQSVSSESGSNNAYGTSFGDTSRFEDKLQYRRENLALEQDNFNKFFLEEPSQNMEFTTEKDRDEVVAHSRNLSAESVWSEISSVKYSETSNPSPSNSPGDGSIDLPSDTDTSNVIEAFSNSEKQFTNDGLVIRPFDQQHKLNRILIIMQQRFMTAKADMEDLIARLDQEIAVKENLTSKVKDLETELEVTRRKTKEDLQQGILLERERAMQIQWDADGLRRKYAEMESKLKFEQGEKAHVESQKVITSGEKEKLLQELTNKTEQLKDLQQRLEELEIKSKVDIKVLLKEVKSLRSSHAEVKEALNQSLKENTEIERVLQKEKQRRAPAKKALNECGVLHLRLQESSVNFLAEGEDKFSVDSSTLSDALGLLTTSDNRIGLLLAEAQLLLQDNRFAREDGTRSSDFSETFSAINNDDPRMPSDDEMMKMLLATIVDNATLRKQLNAVMRCALQMTVKPLKEEIGEASSWKTILNKFLLR